MQHDVLALLARHELYVADFYLLRDRPRATIGRLEHLLAEYDGSGLEPQALVLMGRTYLRMRECLHARDSFEDTIARFPESGFAVQAQRYLDVMCPDEATDAGEPGTDADEDAAALDEEEEDEGSLTGDDSEETEEERVERERREDAAMDAEIEAREHAADAASQPPAPGGSGMGSTPSGAPY